MTLRRSSTMVAAGLLTVIAAALFLPLLERLPPVCFYRTATGHLCALCGMTHALAHVARGEWAAASAANPAWLPILAAFAFTIAQPQRRILWSFIAVVVVATAFRW